MSENEFVLDRLHKMHLLLADQLKNICEEHRLSYFMLGGTMLGAIRHKGFIPWDDDMDFGMPRKDFEIFIALCNSSIDQTKFYLQTDRNDFFYTFNFAK